MHREEFEKIFFLLKALFSFTNPRNWGVIQEIYRNTRFDSAVTISYSQCGEDISILQLLSNKRNGFYIDIGAHDPNRFSVTRLLYQLGWTGINVEANLKVEEKFRKFRPRDKFIARAVGCEPEYLFYHFTESAISTSNTEWAERFVREGNRLENKHKVLGVSLREIINQVPTNTKIDLLNIDIEGSDFDALHSAKFETLRVDRFPLWVVLETPLPVDEVMRFPTVNYMKQFGYEIQCVLPRSTIMKFKESN